MNSAAELSYYPSLGKSLLIVVGAIIFAFASVFMALDKSHEPGFSYVIWIIFFLYLLKTAQGKKNKLLRNIAVLAVLPLIAFDFLIGYITGYRNIFTGIAGFILFGVGGLIYAWQSIVKRRARLRLSPEGIEVDGGLRAGKIALAWNDVESLSISKFNTRMVSFYGWMGKQPELLAVNIKNLETFAARHPAFKPSFLRDLAKDIAGSPLSVQLSGLTKSSEEIKKEVAAFCQAIKIPFTDIQSVPIYEPEDAIKVTYNSLPEPLKTSLSKEDVRIILDLELQFQEKVGIASKPLRIEEVSTANDKPLQKVEDYEGEVTKFILADEKGKNFTAEQIAAVLLAEAVYLKQIGILMEKGSVSHNEKLNEV
ncbi:MAG TPA: STM3941 family protein [Candidatus Paceibacterota bacterium]